MAPRRGVGYRPSAFACHRAVPLRALGVRWVWRPRSAGGVGVGAGVVWPRSRLAAGWGAMAGWGAVYRVRVHQLLHAHRCDSAASGCCLTSMPHVCVCASAATRHYCLPLHATSFCEYPQEIGIQFDEGLVSICQIQLLSHQYLIATKIELFAGVGDSYDTASFKRLRCVARLGMRRWWRLLVPAACVEPCSVFGSGPAGGGALLT